MSAQMSVSSRLSPLCANATAVARPTPRAAPVMNTVIRGRYGAWRT